MIVDKLSNWRLYAPIHPELAEIFEVIEQMARGEVSEKVVIREGVAWVNAPKLTEISDGPKSYEAHRNFLDVHYMLAGGEQFGCANVERLTTVKEYDSQSDCEFLDGELELFNLKQGDFCIVYPQDAHVPAYKKLGEGDLVRVVAKARC